MEDKATRLWFVGLILLNFLWLMKTAANSVGYVDSGELAVAGFTLGIAHPTGYPLYTMLGRVCSVLHPGAVIEGVTFVSTVFGLGAGIFFALLAASLFRTLGIFASVGENHLLAASTSIMVLLYTPVMWSLSATNEVYTLHLFFVSAVFYLILGKNKPAPGDNARTVSLVSYLIGMSLSHHLSTVLLIPAILLWIVTAKPKRASVIRLLPVSIAAIVVPLTVYLYLPIRASLSPIANWGDPSTAESFFRHVSGWQYQTWMFNKSISEIIGSMADLAIMTVEQFPLVMLIPAVCGLVVITRKNGRASVFLALVFVSNLFYIAGYTIPEIDTYLLPMAMIYALWVAIGTAVICRSALNLIRSGIVNKVAPHLTATAMLAAGLYMILANRSYADRSDYRYVETQTQLVLDAMEPRGILLTANWDFYSPLLYEKFVEEKREDITAIDTELLRRSWYYKFIERSDPTLFAEIARQVDRFLPHVARFERGEQYSVAAIEDAYQSIITAIASIPDRPAYVDAGTGFRDIKMFSKIPNGAIYRLVREGEHYTPRPFSRMSLGHVDDRLLESDYSLRKQIRIIDGMNEEWKSFWDWYRTRDAVTPDD